MTKLIALCDGHGMETAGKRTPLLPDGVVMRENEFNRRVVALLDVHLKRCGFRTLLVAPTDADTPLIARTNLANAAKADLYLSIHANAFGAGGLNNVRGIETFHKAGSIEGARAATILHRSLLGGTRLPDRGVKIADFHVLRETRMPAVLAECGFMTNVEEANLLRSETYRAECAEELARGVCEYFGVSCVVDPPVVTDIDISKSVTVCVTVNGENVGNGFLLNGVTYVPARATVTPLGAQITFDAKTQTVNIND